MKCPGGQDNPPQAKFCEECATPVAAADARPAPATYTPKHLAERILTSKAALEGERTLLRVDRDDTA
jgi:hypothetical protein